MVWQAGADALCTRQESPETLIAYVCPIDGTRPSGRSRLKPMREQDRHVEGSRFKVLFVCGVGVGGAVRSTVELADRLAERGHEVVVVVASDHEKSKFYDLGVRSAIKLGSSGLRPVVEVMLRRYGRRTSPTSGHNDRALVLMSNAPENAAGRIIQEFGPQIVIVNSIWREQMSWLARDLNSAGIPWGLYIREEHALTHLTVSGLKPDIVLANSEHFTEQAIEAGVDCTFAPSIVDLSAANADTTRSSVLMINPIAENHPEILVELAERRHDIPCVLQESWPLPTDYRDQLSTVVDRINNLELRPSTPRPADIYRDVRILVATYPSGRPRVVLEAQHNGIPVVALSQPSLKETVRDGGLLVEQAASGDEWINVITQLWDDKELYARLASSAYSAARRPEIAAEAILSTIESVVYGVIS